MARHYGTGIDPRYPEGVAVDISEHNASEQSLVERGLVGPAVADVRSDAELANAAIRGDLSGVPTEQSELDAAFAAGIVDERGVATGLAHDIVHDEVGHSTEAPVAAVVEEAPVEEAASSGRGKRGQAAADEAPAEATA